MITKKSNKKPCFSCGCVIGPEYLETTPFKHGKYTLCGSCVKAMKRRGFCVVGDDTFLTELGALVTVPRKDRVEFLQTIERERRIEHGTK